MKSRIVWRAVSTDGGVDLIVLPVPGRQSEMFDCCFLINIVAGFEDGSERGEVPVIGVAVVVRMVVESSKAQATRVRLQRVENDRG